MRFLYLLSIFMTSCVPYSQIAETLQHASDVIETNTKKIEETGAIIAKNTTEVRGYTIVMKMIFPIIWAALFIFNYVFFRKILNQLEKKRNRL
jgi:hypothetical protein